MSGYREELIARFWRYQRTYFPEWETYFERGEMPDGRPPVFLSQRATHNLLFDPHAPQTQQELLTKKIAPNERHRWFRSMSSSQAIAQSAFGNLALYDRLSCLNEVIDVDGSKVFGENPVSAGNFTMEYKVDSLGEPRPTSLDGFISGEYRIAIECKLTETDVGYCSRPRLKKTASNYDTEFCHGSYSKQRERRSRCALTEVGVLYWRFVPEVFRWPGDIDLTPCPLLKNYQLVRNLLAISVRDGSASLEKGHVVLVYDERNPAFQPGGKGYQAFGETRGALRDPKMLKKCSWQQIVQVLRNKGHLEWLTGQLHAKYDL